MEATTPTTSPARAVTVALASTTSGFLPVFLTATLAVQIRRDVGISAAQLGAAFSVFFASSGLLSVWAGRAADRIGWHRATVIATLGSAASLVGIGLLGTSFASLASFVAFGGACAALVNPASDLPLVRELPANRQGLTFGIKQSSGPIAALLAGLAVPSLGLTVGWRWAFVLATAVPLLTALAVPRRVIRPARPPRPRADDVGTNAGVLVTLAAAGGSGAMVVGTLGSFVVLSIVDAGISEGSAGLLIAAGSVAGIGVRVGAGWLADQRSTDGLRDVTYLLTFGTLAFLLLAIHQPTPAAIGALLAYGAGWSWPGLFTFGVARHHPESPVTASGVVRVGTAAGASLGPVLFGFLVGHVGYSQAWLVVAGESLLAAGLMLLGARKVRDWSGLGQPVLLSD